MRHPSAPQIGLKDRGTPAWSRRRRFLSAGVALGAAMVAVPAFGAPGAVDLVAPLVTVEREGDAIVVQARAEVAATPAQTFATLVDYDRLADFVPDMALSRTIERSGASALVEQRGRASFGPFVRQFTLMLVVEEKPGMWIRATAVGGDFRRFDARYELTAVADARTRIDYRGSFELPAGVPPLVGVPIMRGLIRRQFAALVDEIARRSAA